MAPPSYASALTGDFLAVPPSPKRPREDEQPEVRRTAQSQAWPWPNSNDTIDIRSAVVSLRLHLSAIAIQIPNSYLFRDSSSDIPE
eukprot:scaffold25489_cov238-Isochrysis_galbana.AAC.3